MEIIAQIFGLLGSITASCLFFPQVWSSYKTHETKSLAWSGIFIGMVNGLFWIIYGLLRGDPYIYVTNAILFIGALLLAILKRRYG